MTEDEAKTTQCCGPEGCGYFNTEPRPARWCVASACMAWRWSGETPTPRKGSVDFVFGSSGTAEQRAEVKARMAALRPGFCGLAGAPQ